MFSFVKRPTTQAFLFAGLALTMAMNAQAHHSFAMFDRNSDLKLTGTVSKFEWTNPHVFLIIDSPNDKGEMVRYTLESSSPNLMIHAGWKFNTLKAGDKVDVHYHPLRNGEAGGMLWTVTLPNGTVLNAW